MPDPEPSGEIVLPTGFAPRTFCLRCYRGDVTTAFAISGRSGVHSGVLFGMLRLSDASHLLDIEFRQHPVSGHPFTVTYPLCVECSEEIGVPVGYLVEGASIPCFRDPGEVSDGDTIKPRLDFDTRSGDKWDGPSLRDAIRSRLGSCHYVRYRYLNAEGKQVAKWRATHIEISAASDPVRLDLMDEVLRAAPGYVEHKRLRGGPPSSAQTRALYRFEAS